MTLDVDETFHTVRPLIPTFLQLRPHADLKSCYRTCARVDQSTKYGTSDSRAVKVSGIAGSGLVVNVHSSSDCNQGSFITTISGDNCFTSDEGVGKSSLPDRTPADWFIRTQSTLRSSTETLGLVL